MIHYKIIEESDLEDDNTVGGLHALTLEYWDEIKEFGTPPSTENTIRKIFRKDPTWRWVSWIGIDKEEVVGRASLQLLKPGVEAGEQIKHYTQTSMFVKKTKRRNGIGKELLKRVVNKAQKEVITGIDAISRSPSGKQFCESLDGKVVSETVALRLPLADISDERLADLKSDYQKLTSDISVQITNSLSQKDISDYVALEMVIAEENWRRWYDDKPFDESFAKRDFLEYKKHQISEGIKKTFAFARNKDGRMVGYTRFCYDEHNPDSVELESGCILPEFRGKGLGMLMNVNLICQAKKNSDMIRFVQADTNMKNNSARGVLGKLGFIEMQPSTVFTFDIADLRKKLGIP
jgi:GNAT superfamily N-acetyltransferase